MLIKNFAIEVQRTNPNARIFGMHPGTVDSKLSKPFQKMSAYKKLFQPTFCCSTNDQGYRRSKRV